MDEDRAGPGPTGDAPSTGSGVPDTRSQWGRNAEAWIRLTRTGHDRYRDLVNTPAFFAMLPPVAGLLCLDLGCGEGHNTRLLRRAGARVVGVDIVDAFARATFDGDPSIPTAVGDGCELPIASSSVDVLTAFMSLMDVPDPEAAIREVSRVLRPGGITQFSIGHPTTTTPVREWRHDADGERTALSIGDYFHEGPVTDRWMFGTAPPGDHERPFTITLARRTLSSWLNLLIDCGLRLTRVAEPAAGTDLAARHPEVADTRVAPYFLLLQASKA